MRGNSTLGKTQIGLAGGALALCLLAVCLLHPPSASAASTCPGRNGQVAVSMSGGNSRSSEVIGVVTPTQNVRALFGPRRLPIEGLLNQPSFSCDDSEIVYSLNNESGCESLEIVNVATGRRRELGTPPLCGDHPAFLSDGRIVFDAHHATYVVDANGSHLRRLFGEEVDASAANGRWFIGSGFRTFFLLNAKGQRIRSLAPPCRRAAVSTSAHISLLMADRSSTKRQPRFQTTSTMLTSLS